MVPIRQAAAATWIFGAAIITWLAVTTYGSARTWLPNLIARATLALALVLLPVHREETIGTVANLHFVMLFVGLVVLISEPLSKLERINGWVVLVVLGLSTPIALALVPFAAWRVARQRPWRLDGLTIAWFAGVLVQFSAIVLVRPQRPPSEGTPGSSIAARYVTDVVAENFFPIDRAARVVGLLIGLALLVTVALAVVASWRRRDIDRVLVLIAVPVVGFGTYVVSTAGYGARFRYALFPALCLLWVGLFAVETLTTVRRKPNWATDTVLFGAIATVMLIAWLPQWSASPYQRSGDSWARGLDAAATRCANTVTDEVEIIISPTELPPGRSWSVRVNCNELSGAEGG
jgi:hypothetical protein